MRFLSIIMIFVTAVLKGQSTVSFTFDDGTTGPLGGYPGPVWNSMLLGHLKKNDVKAIFFVTGSHMSSAAGASVLQAWHADGHSLANHTWSHKNYQAVTFEAFKKDFIRNDSFMRASPGFIRMFRFPYLKEGDTKDKIAAFRVLLREQGYANGYVTIDASDWYVATRLQNRLKENPKADVSGFRDFYLLHILDRADYYEKLAFGLTGRHIHHTLLLHHNLASALFLGDLIKAFRDRGWTIADAPAAYADEIFQAQPTVVPAGESLIWSLAKESGKYENILRYPAEDGDYLKDDMDKLGL